MLAAAAVFGLIIGLAVGMLGGGGSVLAVPVLVYVLDQPVEQATTTSLLVVAAGALAGALSHARAGRVCWRHAAAYSAGALPGIAAGTALGDSASASPLLVAFAVVMVLGAAATWRRAGQPDTAEPQPAHGTCPPLRPARTLAAGAGVGVITGLFGVGGGFLIVPTLAVGLTFTMRSAVGTSLTIVAATSLMGLVVHLAAGRHVDADITATMALACITGALLGVAVARRAPQRELARAFAALVVAVAAYLVISATMLGGPPGAS